MTTNEKFISALREMNSIMKQDIKDGHQWKYCNVTSKKANSFASARKQGKYLLNCVDGVQWGCKIAGIPSSALSWYGSEGSIGWCSKNAEANARKYFDIIKVGNKTVKQLVDSGSLCEGDILTYMTMSHTNVYLGDIGKYTDRSFDSGHAYCTGSGEGAKFKKWIGSLSCKSSRVSYILRIKDRVHYRVQAGAYNDINKANEQVALLKENGFNGSIKDEDGMYKVQVGYFSGKKNAEKLVAKLNKKKIPSFVKEI